MNTYTDMWGIISNDINFYYVLHETRNGLFAYPKGCPGPEQTHRTLIPCSDDIENRVRQIRSNNGILDRTKMLVLLSLASNEMIKFMCMYPEVWFMDCTFGESSSLVLQIHFVSAIFYGETILTSRTITFCNFFCLPITLKELTGRRRIYLLLQCVQQEEIPYQ